MGEGERGKGKSRGVRFRFARRELKLEVQQKIVCWFAPEGRHVYSLAAFFFAPKLRRSVIALTCSVEGSAPGFAPNGARIVGRAGSYKHLAPLERKRIQLLHL